MSDEQTGCDPFENGFSEEAVRKLYKDEITRLRAENERLRLENDKLREALTPLAAMDVELLDENKKPTGIHAFDTWDQNQVVFDIGKDRKIVVADLRRARAALDGVTEPASPWLDIESAPKDGNPIEVWDESPGAVNPAVVYWENGVWVYADDLLADAAPEGALPSHWRQCSEPPR